MHINNFYRNNKKKEKIMRNLMFLAARKNVRFPKVIVTTLVILMLVLFAGTQNISAEELTAADLSFMTQSTASDIDALLLSQFAGYTLPQPGVPDQTINYSSIATDSTWTNWTAALSGTYFDQALNLNYVNGTGTASIVSWETTGTFGGVNITGSGTSAISYPTSSTFDLTLSEILVCAGNTYALNYTDIPGTFLPNGDIMFGSPGDEEVGIGTFTINSIFFSAPLISYNRVVIDNKGTVLYTESDICGKSFAIGLKNNYDSDGNLFQGDITTPEPATFALLSLGCLTLLKKHKP